MRRDKYCVWEWSEFLHGNWIDRIFHARRDFQNTRMEGDARVAYGVESSYHWLRQTSYSLCLQVAQGEESKENTMGKQGQRRTRTAHRFFYCQIAAVALACSGFARAAPISYSESANGELISGFNLGFVSNPPVLSLGAGVNTVSGRISIFDFDGFAFTVPQSTSLNSVNLSFSQPSVPGDFGLPSGAGFGIATGIGLPFAPAITTNVNFSTGTSPTALFSTATPFGPGTYTIGDYVHSNLNGFVDYTFSLNVAPNVSPTQTLYLNFDSGLIGVPRAALSWWSGEEAVYTKPDAGLTDIQEADVVRRVSEIFSPFRIAVTATKPEVEHSTAFIGGTLSALGEKFADRLAGLLGVAEKLDFDNADKTDVAHVFSGEMGLPTTNTSFFDTLVLTIAHEAGHILGLQHVTLPGELMFPSSPGLGTAISDQTVPLSLPSLGCQNSHQELGRNVGFLAGLPTERTLCEKEGAIAGSLVAFGDALFLYGAKLAVIYDGDSGPTIFELGDLGIGGDTIVDLPVRAGLKFSLYGSSSPGSPIDIISSPLGLDGLSPFETLSDLSVHEILSDFPSADPSLLNLFRFNDGLGFSPVGAALLHFDAPGTVPEPSSLLLTTLAIFLHVCLTRKRGYRHVE